MKPGHRFSPRRPPAMDMIPQGWSLIGRPLLLRLIATVQGWKKEDWPSVNRTVVHVFGGLRISQPLVVKEYGHLSSMAAPGVVGRRDLCGTTPRVASHTLAITEPIPDVPVHLSPKHQSVSFPP